MTELEESQASRLTVKAFLEDIFPRGYVDVEVTRDDETRQLRRAEIQLDAPFHPADVFGACCLLLSQSGAYSQFAVKNSPTTVSNLGYELTEAQIDEAMSLGQRWRLDLSSGDDWPARKREVMAQVAEWWNEFATGTMGDTAIYDRSLKLSKSPKAWWPLVHRLMIAADEAAEDIADFNERDDGLQPYWTAVEEARYVESYLKVEEAKQGLNGGNKYAPPVGSSLAPSLSRDFACVQSKRRTPMIGCTLRTLSNNLSLLPARGIVRTALYGNPHGGHSPVAERGLNVLLVPFPFNISASWFQPSATTGYGGAGHPKDTRNSMFKLNQRWLQKDQKPDGDYIGDKILQFIDALIKKAREDTGTVDAIIFPEYALNWKIYSDLSKHILENHNDVEFLVSGSSSNCREGDAEETEGNFAFSSYFFEQTDGARFAIDTSRPKHHRWQLNRSQIEDYALSSALDPRRWWWEDIHISEREVYFHNFRENSIYSVMICEDLARSEPCHDLLRAVAPNLLFVLLMDGPQMPHRWPARYATVLAEDPGSSVLTLTSRGLIARSNRTGTYPPNWNVALWKDDKGKTREIACDPQSQAVLLTISGVPRKEMSIDSRATHSIAWRYHGSQPVALDRNEHGDLLRALQAI